MFQRAGCSLLRAEGFSCNLDVLHGGLGIKKLLIDMIFLLLKNCAIVKKIVQLLKKGTDPDPVSQINADPFGYGSWAGFVVTP